MNHGQPFGQAWCTAALPRADWPRFPLLIRTPESSRIKYSIYNLIGWMNLPKDVTHSVVTYFFLPNAETGTSF